VYYLSDRLSEAHSLQLVWAKLERSSLTSCLTRRTQSVGKLPHKKNAVHWQAASQEERSTSFGLAWRTQSRQERFGEPLQARPISRHVAGRNKIEYTAVWL